MLFGFFTEITITLVLNYIYPFNIVFSTRDLVYIHYGTPGMPFAVMMVIYDETKKYLLRNVKPVSEKKPNWIVRNCQW